MLPVAKKYGDQALGNEWTTQGHTYIIDVRRTSQILLIKIIDHQIVLSSIFWTIVYGMPLHGSLPYRGAEACVFQGG